jgi:hypothetical protein
MQLWSADVIMVLSVAHANFVGVPPPPLPPLLELHATADAAHASASALKARNPIMKEPPGVNE